MTSIEPKFIYFDLGGVAFHFRGGLNKLADKYGLEYQDFEQVFRKYDDQVCRGKISAQELWNIYKTELGLPDDKIKNFAEYWVGNFEPITQTKQLMVDVADKYKVGLLTNIYSEVFPKIREREILPDINWDAQVHSCEVGFVKPEPEIYEVASQRAGEKPAEIFFIDDKQSFIEGAEKAGWQTFLFDEKDVSRSVAKIREILGLI